MSNWTDQWRNFVKETSYLHSLAERNISNDQFWRSFGIYDLVLNHSGYPGEILAKISSFISPESTLLDIGAGTGAFTIPLSKIASKVIAVDPSAYQMQVLFEKAKGEGLTNIIKIEKEWKDVKPSEISEITSSAGGYSGGYAGGEMASGIVSDNASYQVDYSLAAYSLFDLDIENFLKKMIDVTGKGIFIVFRAGGADSLSEYAYGSKPFADYICLGQILKDMGYKFNDQLFTREYQLPINLVFQQYRFCQKGREELINHLKKEGRLEERSDGMWAAFKTTDALLHMIR